MSAVVAIGAALSACGTHPSAAATAVARARLANPTALAVPAPVPAADAASAPAEAIAKAPAESIAKASAEAVAKAPAAAPASPPRPSPALGNASQLPSPGNPGGHAYVPPAARAVSSSHPTHVIGTGTPGSCTSAAVVKTVYEGGIITFNCGPKPVTINMTATAEIRNTSRQVVLDGGGKVVLSGMGKRRILYMNTCDKSLTWIHDSCIDQATPQLTVQNLTFTDGRAQGRGPRDMAGGSGGAIYDEGGQLRVVNSRFTNNRCFAWGPDLGGAAIRAFEMYAGQPVYIVHSTFTGGECSNGGALSSIAASWSVLNSVLSDNRATGWGANPPVSGTVGGGNGGAIYTDGDRYGLTVNGSVITSNSAPEGGGAIFYVSDDRTGTLHVDSSTMEDNPSGRFYNFPGTIFYIGHGKPVFTNSHFDH
jgi:hypothetical protein